MSLPLFLLGMKSTPYMRITGRQAKKPFYIKMTDTFRKHDIIKSSNGTRMLVMKVYPNCMTRWEKIRKFFGFYPRVGVTKVKLIL